MVTRRVGLSMLLAAVPSMLPRALRAAEERPSIRVVVPFAAGGPADSIARMFAAPLTLAAGAPVVIENHTGGGGTLGALAAARSAPDGQTLLVGNTSTHSIAPVLDARLGYDPERDFSPIALLGRAPGLLLVPAGSSAQNLAELIALARRRPGALNFGSSGQGTVAHLAMEHFKLLTGTYIVHIPYRGTAPALVDLIAGRLDMLIDSVLTAQPHIRAGTVRALAICTPLRSPLWPELPTAAEQVPGFEAASWFGLFGPRGLKPEWVEQLAGGVAAALREQGLRERLALLGAEPGHGGPAELLQTLRQDSARWAEVVRSRGLRPQA